MSEILYVCLPCRTVTKCKNVFSYGFALAIDGKVLYLTEFFVIVLVYVIFW
jgi:hypothetical protein